MPTIVATGRAVFATRPDTIVTFEKKVVGEYAVFVTGNGGPTGKEIEAYTVCNRNETGFTVRSSYGSSKSIVDWMVVRP
jgi:hypothetical protein